MCSAARGVPGSLARHRSEPYLTIIRFRPLGRAGGQPSRCSIGSSRRRAHSRCASGMGSRCQPSRTRRSRSSSTTPTRYGGCSCRQSSTHSVRLHHGDFDVDGDPFATVALLLVPLRCGKRLLRAVAWQPDAILCGYFPTGTESQETAQEIGLYLPHRRHRCDRPCRSAEPQLRLRRDSAHHAKLSMWT
jgi:hypothetical protein